jgi:hypothetical protein
MRFFKRIVILMVVACFVSALDTCAVKFDLEPGEPDYETYGEFGGICFLMDLPILSLRGPVWLFLGQCLSSHPAAMRFLGDHECIFIWLFDPLLVFAIAGIFYGLRHLWRHKRKHVAARHTFPEKAEG